ncbi:MAG TPA: tetratricopeptide repeat protein, partial [Acidobacteriota bacterium]|nr:tetratricopeptide repeat protein [Acidobacteriota bacterium]
MSLRKLRIGPLLLAFTLLTPALSAQSAERLFQAALYQEEVEGEPASAIEMYQEILKQFPDARSISAQAQLHIGLCFEKLGHEKAREAYEAVVREFADQPDIVAEARNRLAEIDRAVSSREGKPNFRKIEIPGRPDNGVFSPDGKQLAFFADGGLWIVPVRGNVSPDIAGEPTRIADVPEANVSGNLLSWSANGEWIAVNGEFAGEDTVYVVPSTGGDPKLVPLPPRGGHSWSYRMSLSPDGEQLAISALELGLREQKTTVDRYIYTVPTDGGALQRLTFNWSRLPAYSPDGKYIA